MTPSVQTSLEKTVVTDRLSPPDRKILDLARQFDPQALADIFDVYSPRIYRYAVRLLGDSDLAQECMAETFRRFLTALQHGSGPVDHLQAYLYRIAHNWITDTYRRRPPPELPLDLNLPIDPADETAQLVSGEFERQNVRAALALLTPDQRQVITLKYFEDWQNEEIARALNKPIGAVKSLQHRALAALRRILLQQEEVEP